MNTSNAERSGRPDEATTPEIVDKIHNMVMDDRRLKVREIASVWVSRVNGYIIFYINI
jgi:ribosomal protein L20